MEASIAVALITTLFAISGITALESNVLGNHDDGRAPCPYEKIVNLEALGESWIGKEKIFFIETSGRPYLKQRQACAVESAVVAAGGLPAVVVMTSKTLDLSASNATCQIFRKYAEHKVFFRYVDVYKVFVGTPLEELQIDGIFAKSDYKMVHYSDAIRLILVYKYGGWYSDVDVVFLRPLRGLSNVISGDHVSKENTATVGSALNNAVFHFDAGHPYLKHCLDLFKRSYDPAVRLSGGPKLMTSALFDICETGTNLANGIELSWFNADRCRGVTVLPAASFYPVGWFHYGRLYSELRTPDSWAEFFSRSYVVHMYNSSKNTARPILRPHYFGSEWPAYLYLALNMCPVSFYSEKKF